MDTLLWFCLAALITAWSGLRYWQRLAAEAAPLRAERNLAQSRWPMFLVVLVALTAAYLPQSLHVVAGRSGEPPTLLGDLMPLTLLALFLVSGIAALPVRRHLLGETWGIRAYLTDQCRLLLSFGSGMLLLLFLPLLVLKPEDPWQWGLALLAGIVLNLWLWWQGRVIAWLMDASPLSDPAQAEACAALLHSPALHLAGRRVTLQAIGHREGGLINAIAVSGLRQCHVFVTRRLLAILNPRETAAICAHELAHLEWRNRRWLLRYRGVWLLLTLLGLALPGLLLSPPWWLPVAWMFVLLMLFLYLQRHQRNEEAACDARALELGAEPTALASGLIKLHRAMLVPRRVSLATDQSMSHPSLARRLQSIRTLADQSDETGPSEPLLLDTGAGHIRLDGEGVSHYPQGAGEPDWRKPFRRLVEIYLQPDAKQVRLVMREAEGAPIQTALSTTDLGPLQHHLDQVDHQLAPVPEKHLGFERWTSWISLLVMLAVYTHPDRIVTPYQHLMLLAPALVLLYTRLGSMLLLLSSIALGLALALLLEPVNWQLKLLPLLLGLSGMGLWGGWLLRGNHYRFKPRGALISAVLCLLLAGFAWLDAALRPWDPELLMRLHALGTERASLILPLLALGVVLTFSGRWFRLWGTAVALGSLLLLALTASGPYAVLNPDPLSLTLPAPPQMGRQVVFEQQPLPGKAHGLQVSPSGRRFLAWLDGQQESGPMPLVFGEFNGPSQEAVAEDAAFSQERLLTARREAGQLRLVLLDPSTPQAELWRLQVPLAKRKRELMLWTEGDKWFLEQWNSDEAFNGHYRGHIGNTEWQFDQELPEPEEKAKPALAATWKIKVDAEGTATPGVKRLWRRGMLRRGRRISRVQLRSPQGELRTFTTADHLHCQKAKPGGQRLCLIYAGRGQSRSLKIWMFDDETGDFAPRFQVGSGFSVAYGDNGLLLLGDQPGRQRLLWVSPAQASPLVLETEGAPLTEAQVIDGVIYGLQDMAQTSRIVRLTLPDGPKVQ